MVNTTHNTIDVSRADSSNLKVIVSITIFRGKLISVPMAVSLIASNQNILFLKYFMKDSIDQINLSEPERMVCLVSI
jgi:hypothetical protein